MAPQHQQGDVAMARQIKTHYFGRFALLMALAGRSPRRNLYKPRRELSTPRMLVLASLVTLLVGLPRPMLASAASSSHASASVAPRVTADFNGDGRADLAVGVPLEDFAAGK